MRFDENIRNLRKEKDYSQEYLAEKLGVTRQTISKWENGSAMPDLKKLIELADFFEVSMDDLLGLDYKTINQKPNSAECAGNDHAEAILANKYTNDLINNVSNRINSKTKGISILLVFVAVGLAISIISFSGMISSLESRINSLNDTIFYLQQNNPIINYNDNDNDYYDIEMNILKIYAETPYIVQTELKYSPTSYPKNSKIYYLIPKEDGSVDRLEAEDNNGEFVAKADIDLSLDQPIYFVLDDGENIVKQEVDIFIREIFGASVNSLLYEINYIANDEFRFSNGSSDAYIWMISKYVDVASADIVVLAEGKEVFRQALKKSELNINSEYQFEMPTFSVKNLKISREMDIYVEIKLENGVVCKDYIPYSNPADTSDDPIEELRGIEYIFKNGDKTVTIKNNQ